MSTDYKPIPVAPLTGVLESRVPLDATTPDSFRFRENFSSTEQGKLCRAPGFTRLFSGNADFHDQLLPLLTYYDNQVPKAKGADKVTAYPNSTLCGSILNTRTNGRSPITSGFMAQTDSGSRRLMIGTSDRIAVLNETTLNYRIIADGMGESGYGRFHYATVKNQVIITNNVDKVRQWKIDDSASGCEMQSAHTIPDLDVIALSRAAVVAEFDNTIFLGDVTMDNLRFPNRLVWSDVARPLAYDPADPASITGFIDLDPGHTILAAKKLGLSLMVYTDKGIYRVSATGGAPAFSAAVVYRHKEGDKCLAYRNTLCDYGIYHFYAARDGFYVYDPYQPEPTRIEWMHSSSGIVYNGIPGYRRMNRSACEAHCAVFKPDVGEEDGEGEIWFSWAEEGSSYPTKTLVLNTRFEFAYTIDHGFSMLVNYIPDPRPSMRDWLLQTCSCTVSQDSALGIRFVKEALPAQIDCPPQPQGFSPTCIYTKTTVTVDGLTTEDWNAAEADGDSLCAFLEGALVDDYCKACPDPNILIGASSSDYCLKHIGQGYVREICTNGNTPTGPGTPYENINGQYSSFVGTYDQQGYYSTLRVVPQSYGARTVKNIKRLFVEFQSDDQTYPCVLQMRVGKSYHAADPNSVAIGGVIWAQTVRKLLQETDILTPQEYADQNLIPSQGMEFPVYQSGQWLYWEMKIANLSDPNDLNSSLLPATGGASCFSAVYSTVRQVSKFVK